MIKNYKFFDIQIPEETKKILISFSGGSDSLLTLYSVCDYIKSFDLGIEVACVHGLDLKDCSESLHNVDIMLDKLKEIFNIDIPLHVFEYRGLKGKTEKHSRYINEIIIENNYDMIIYGSSANPPKDIMQKIYPEYNSKKKRRPDRDIMKRMKEPLIKKQNYGNKTGYMYFPLLRLHKKQINEVSLMFPELNNLQSLTRSCDNTKNGLPCKNCYSCAEKKWAFGYYDGGITE